MKLSIQLHLAGLSLSNTVSILKIFGVQRARSAIHNWVHKADLQPTDGREPNHVAVDETVIRLDDEPLRFQTVSATPKQKLLTSGCKICLRMESPHLNTMSRIIVKQIWLSN